MLDTASKPYIAGRFKTKLPTNLRKTGFVGSGCHILILKRARSETGEFEHARHGGIESGHVLATCRGEVGCATAAALDELCGSLDEIAGVQTAFAHQVFAEHHGEERFVVVL